MRKGTMLVEMLVVLAVTATVSIALSALFRTLLSDIPRTYQTFNTNHTIQMIIQQIRSDVETSISLSQSSDDQSADEELLLMELPEGVIAYQKNEDRLIRYTFNIDPNSSQYQEKIWHEPQADIQWRLRKRKDKNYAVEVSTSVEYKTSGRTRNLLANSYIFFMNVYAEADK